MYRIKSASSNSRKGPDWETRVPVHHSCKNRDLFVCCESCLALCYAVVLRSGRSSTYTALTRRYKHKRYKSSRSHERPRGTRIHVYGRFRLWCVHPRAGEVPASLSISVPALCIWYTKSCECINSCSTSVSRLHLYWVCVLVLSPRLHCCSRCRVLRRPLSMQVRGFK